MILEHSFHTNATITAWLLNDANLDALVRAEANAIASYYGISKEKKSGWHEEDGGWRYYNGDTGDYVRNKWVKDTDGKWYWFDGAGMMVTNVWYMHNGHWYYLGAGGAMCTSRLIESSGKVYAVDSDGKMVTEPITLTPDQDGALQYPGIG